MLLDLAQLLHRVFAVLSGTRRQILILQELDIGQRGGAGNWVSTERRKMITGFVSGCDFGTRGEGAEGESVGDALGSDQNVRLDAIVLKGKHLSGAAKAGLYFIGDEQYSVLVEDFLDFAEIVLGRNDDSTLTQHWLGDECGNVTRGFESNHVVEALRAMAGTVFWIRLAKKNKIHRRKHGRKARAVRGPPPLSVL